jgi:hypothetical protein
MKTLLIVTLGSTLALGACRADVSGTADTPLASEGAVAADGSTQRAAPPRAAPARAAYRDVTIPAGTTLPLVLTSGIASDTSAVEDAVSAELTRSITIDGREALPAGTRFAGHVTDVDDSGRVKGRAMIAFRFTSLSTGDQQYDIRTEPVSHLAEATKSEDATKIGIGAGAGAVIGGILGGKEGAAKGAIVGGGAGTGVVLATKGREVRLASGADATTELTSPVTVRVRLN